MSSPRKEASILPRVIAPTGSVPNAPTKDRYPRPQFARADWLSLDGTWEFGRGPNSLHEVEWEGVIRVPFAPEAPLSGVADGGGGAVVWYRRYFEVPDEWSGRRVILHFGAVDHRATVWLNGHLVARHEGGHTPFRIDASDALRSGAQELVVRAEDDPHDLHKPRGKQDWRDEPHAIWYPRTSGIWQSVWLEPVAPQHLEQVRFTPDLTSFSIEIEVGVAGDLRDLALEVVLSLHGSVLAHDVWGLRAGKVRRTVSLPDPGIDDARNEYLWSPESPTLFDVEFRLVSGEIVLDEVSSYTALREVAAREGSFFLNGRPYFLRLVLDQGYWPDGLMTPPDADALRRDVEWAKRLGFNGVRKHQKIEDPRYLYWADRLGLLVWEELPSAYGFSPHALQRLAREWMEAIERDANHPCIVTWVPFNESWGVPDLPTSGRQRDAVRALHALTRALDPTRPVIGNDGWEFVVGDMLTVHDYAADPDVLRGRYADPAAVARALASHRPGGRSLRTEAVELADRPVILSEFGGIRLAPEGGEDGWGYSHVTTADAFLDRYRALVGAASGAGLAGFCYTQLTDTFQEQNGLLNMDRDPKCDPTRIALATRNEPERAVPATVGVDRPPTEPESLREERG